MAGDFESVDDYIAAQPEEARELLERVRRAILGALGPRAEETISYKMPAYKIAGKAVLQFAAWKKHYALYAATPSVVAKFKKELAPYEILKGTIRFPYAGKAPVRLIEEIAKLRTKDIAGGDKAK